MKADADDIAGRPAPRRGLGQAAAWARPGLRGFFAWWGRSLAQWLPVRLRSLLGLDARRLLLRRQAGVLVVSLERDGAQRELAQVPLAELTLGAGDVLKTVLPAPLASVPRWLVLPSTLGLRRSLVVPAAAGERLRAVLGYEVDRQTPFSADQVRHDARLLGRRGADQLDVELVVVPREAFDAQLTALGPLAGGLAGVDLDDTGHTPLAVNLLPDASRHRHADPMRRWNLLLAACAVLALVAGMWQMLDNRRAAAGAFEQASRVRIDQARAASTQRQEIDELVRGMRYLDDARSGRPTMLELLEALTRRLPDSTHLEKLAIENDRILLIGLSTEASALVGQLEDSPLWRAPALTGALQPDPRSRRDRFTLTAELVLGPTTAAPDGGDDAQRVP